MLDARNVFRTVWPGPTACLRSLLGAVALAPVAVHAAPVDLPALIDSLSTVHGLIQLAVLAGCLLAPWVIVRLWRGSDAPEPDIWFGARIVDGVLFQLLAWCAVLAASWALERVMRVPLLHIAAPILLSLALIRATVLVLRMAYPESRGVRIAERTFSWLVWFAAVLWLTGLLPVLLQFMESVRWHLGGSDISLRSLLEGGLTVLVVMLVMLWLSALIERRLLLGALENLSVRKMAASMTRAVLLVVGVLVALSVAGIPLAALGVLSGALGVGIGFGLQKLASNYVSGFVILAERSLRIGDMVKVDQFEGRITDIKARYTIVRALNGRESIVPNELLVTSRIENASLANRELLVQSTVQVAYGTDLDVLLPRVLATINGVPRVIDRPAASVLLSNFAPDGLELTLCFWIDDPDNGLLNVRSDVNLAVLRLLNELQVSIPLPQRVIYQGSEPPVHPGSEPPAVPG